MTRTPGLLRLPILITSPATRGLRSCNPRRCSRRRIRRAEQGAAGHVRFLGRQDSRDRHSPAKREATQSSLPVMTLELGYAVVSTLIFLAFFAVTLSRPGEVPLLPPRLLLGSRRGDDDRGNGNDLRLLRSHPSAWGTSSPRLSSSGAVVTVSGHLAANELGAIAVDHITTPKNETFYWLDDCRVEHPRHGPRRFRRQLRGASRLRARRH